MKELSIEEKAKRYDKAIEKAEKWHNAPNVDKIPTFGNRIIEDIFPELKESDDERIRKELTDYIKSKFENSCSPTPSKNILSNWIAWLEKQGEQKSVNKVEPKFHVYDWVVTDKGDTVQIGAVNNGYYTLFNGMDFNMSYVDKYWHKWNIRDAKEGDILCTYECGKPKIVFILKGTPINYCVLSYYCYYNFIYPYFEYDSRTGCIAVNNEDIKPATKEQCNTLFQEMKEAGYEWNADKKELIKL